MRHIGIIMDGNRRWARNNKLASILGHQNGAKNAEKIVKHIASKGIEYITLWALSNDNVLKRGKQELSAIINLINGIEDRMKDLIEEGVKFDCIGNLSLLPQKTQEILSGLKEKTKNNSGLTLILALAYGGQDEIIRGIKKVISKGMQSCDISPETFRNFLDTACLPVVDLIIRTGGRQRHSGFLLYDSAYTEYYFSDKMWPDFSEKDLDIALEWYHGVQRNFGK